MIARRGGGPLTIPAQWLVAALLALLALDNLLLPVYLGLSPAIAVVLIVVVCSGIAMLASRPFAGAELIPARVVGLSLLVALAVFMLGGQGRVFYANADWQVRDAVLADMATHPWPFAYMLGGVKVFLRAPLGMYLVPALAGRWHELALLFSNSLRLALLLSLGWQLFDSTAKRWFALAAMLAFSGWDILGTTLMAALGVHVSWDHLEQWSLMLQYSSDITLALWVPNHALAGWTCALTFELWRRGRAPVGVFAAAVPLVAIWSPLALMGTVPFVLIAGITALLRRAFGWRDIALAGLALAVAIPSLWFMTIDAGAVAKRIDPPNGFLYFAMMLLEVLPFVVPPLLAKSTDPHERVTIWAVFLCLLLMPFYQVGASSDFEMRASIMPLALLALTFARWVTRAANEKPVARAALVYAGVALLIGAVTPALEIHRALVMRPSPAPRCSLVGVWARQTGYVAPTTTYLAWSSALPAGLRDFPVTAGLHDPAQCWDHAWMEPR